MSFIYFRSKPSIKDFLSSTSSSEPKSKKQKTEAPDSLNLTSFRDGTLNILSYLLKKYSCIFLFFVLCAGFILLTIAESPLSNIGYQLYILDDRNIKCICSKRTVIGESFSLCKNYVVQEKAILCISCQYIKFIRIKN